MLEPTTAAGDVRSGDWRRLISALPMLAAMFTAMTVEAQTLPELRFAATLSGAQVVPASDGDRLAVARVAFDAGFEEMRISIEFAGDPSINRAQFRCARAGEVGPVVLDLLDSAPLLRLTGDVQVAVDNGDVTVADCDSPIVRSITNLAALAFAMREGLIYLRLDSLQFRSDLRGQFLAESTLEAPELPESERTFPSP